MVPRTPQLSPRRLLPCVVSSQRQGLTEQTSSLETRVQRPLLPSPHPIFCWEKSLSLLIVKLIHIHWGDLGIQKKPPEITSCTKFCKLRLL